MKKIILFSVSCWSFGQHLLCQHIPKVKFPQFSVKTLNNTSLTLPNDLTHSVNIVILVFEQQAQSKVDTWAELILAEMEPQDQISYYEVPMISGVYSLIGRQIDRWMKAGIPVAYHDNTATFYGDRRFIFEGLDVTDRSNCYLFVLDKLGYIHFRAEGVRTPKLESEFRQVVLSLMNNEN